MQVGYQGPGATVVKINGTGIGAEQVIGRIEDQDVFVGQDRQVLAEQIAGARVGIEQFDADTGNHRRRLDAYVFRIDQERAAFAERRAGIGQAAKLRLLLAGDFDKAAIACVGAAARLQSAGKPVDAIRPSNHPATVTVHARAGLKTAGAADKHVLRIRHAVVQSTAAATDAQ